MKGLPLSLYLVEFGIHLFLIGVLIATYGGVTGLCYDLTYLEVNWTCLANWALPAIVGTATLATSLVVTRAITYRRLQVKWLLPCLFYEGSLLFWVFLKRDNWVFLAPFLLLVLLDHAARLSLNHRSSSNN